MLQLEVLSDSPYWSVIISGPKGNIMIQDLVWIDDRQDMLSIVYWESWAVLQGHYDCCLSIPGKVTLLPPNDPG